MRPSAWLFVLLGALMALAIPWSSQALATAACDTSWQDPVSGDWLDPDRWTNGVPGSNDACITADGTYVVTVGDHVSAGSLTVGGSSGSQTVQVLGDTADAWLEIGGPGTIGANALVTLGSAGLGTARFDVQGTLTNAGEIRSDPGGAEGRTLNAGSVVNNGAVAIDKSLVTTSAWTNAGSVDVAAGQTLDHYGNFMWNSGAIAASGLFRQWEGTLTANGGVQTGTPLQLWDATLAPVGTGSAVFDIRNTSYLGSNVASGYTLRIDAYGFGGAVSSLNDTAQHTNRGLIVLTSTDGNGSAVLALGGEVAPLTNLGTIRVETGAGAPPTSRIISGFLLNRGTVAIEEDTSTGNGTWTNEGPLTIAAGKQLTSGGAFIWKSGTITTNGTFHQGLQLFEAIGGTAGPNPIRIAGSMLSPRGSGTATFDIVGGAARLDSDVGKGYTLVIRGSDEFEHGGLRLEANWTSKGTIRLEGPAPWFAQINSLTNKTLTNSGLLEVLPGGPRSLGISLVNLKTMRLGANAGTFPENVWTNKKLLEILAGVSEQHQGSFIQTNGGTLRTFIDSATTYGSVLTVEDSTIAGTLAVVRKKTYKPPVGTTFDVVSSQNGSVIGTFDKKVTGVVVSGVRYLRPTYFPALAQLVVTNAVLSLSPTSGPPGTSVTLDGSGWPAGDEVALTFTDSNGTITTLPSATADGSGEFTVARSVPGDADPGNGKLIAKSVLTGVKVSKTFSVA